MLIFLAKVRDVDSSHLNGNILTWGLGQMNQFRTSSPRRVIAPSWYSYLLVKTHVQPTVALRLARPRRQTRAVSASLARPCLGYLPGTAYAVLPKVRQFWAIVAKEYDDP